MKIRRAILAHALLWGLGCLALSAALGYVLAGAVATVSEPYMTMSAMALDYVFRAVWYGSLLLPIVVIGAAALLGGVALVERWMRGVGVRLTPAIADRASVVGVALVPWAALWGWLRACKDTARPSVDIVQGKPAWVHGWFVQSSGTVLVCVVVAVVIAVAMWPIAGRIAARLPAWGAEGACTRCGYDLRGLPGDTCPECGCAGGRARGVN